MQRIKKLIEKKKILITGINGFLGKQLAMKLDEQNEVIGISIRNNENSQFLQNSNSNIIEGDVSISSTFDKIKSDIDYIFHFGSPASNILFKKDPIRCYENTVHGMFNILEFAKTNNVKKVIYPSSSTVYGRTLESQSENTVPKPSNIYGAAKISCESIASTYIDSVDSLGLRIFAAYGPGEEQKLEFSSIINLFLQDVKNNREPVIYGDGKQTRDFIYIDDTIQTIINSIDCNYSGIINVGTGVPTTFNEIIEKISHITGKQINPKYVKKEFNYIENLKADTKLMKQYLKINPISVEAGIKKFAKYLRV